MKLHLLSIVILILIFEDTENRDAKTLINMIVMIINVLK